MTGTSRNRVIVSVAATMALASASLTPAPSAWAAGTGTSAGKTPVQPVYVAPNSWPTFDKDSSFKSLYPTPPAPTAAPAQAPRGGTVSVPVPGAPASQPAAAPASGGGVYTSGGNPNPPVAGAVPNTGFYSEGPPIVDPSSVPQELVFEPRGKHPSGKPSAAPSRSPDPAATAAQE